MNILTFGCCKIENQEMENQDTSVDSETPNRAHTKKEISRKEYLKQLEQQAYEKAKKARAIKKQKEEEQDAIEKGEYYRSTDVFERTQDRARKVTETVVPVMEMVGKAGKSLMRDLINTTTNTTGNTTTKKTRKASKTKVRETKVRKTQPKKTGSFASVRQGNVNRLPETIHTQSKAETYTVEGYNSILRHFLARLRRKTKCYTKSLEMLKYSVLLLMKFRNKELAMFS
jgi:insertion element IS1 protein InsB